MPLRERLETTRASWCVGSPSAATWEVGLGLRLESLYEPCAQAAFAVVTCPHVLKHSDGSRS